MATDDVALHTKHMQYIDLLEKRIAQLETTLNNPAPIPDQPVKAKVKEEGEKSDGADKTKEPGEAKKDGEGAASRYRNVLRKWDKDSGAFKDEFVETDRFDKPKKQGIAYTFRRTYNPETGERDAYSDIEIEGPELIRVLKEEIGKYPGLSFDTDIVTMISPFPAIIHNWEKLHERAEASPDDQACRDLKNLLGRVRNSAELEAYFKLQGSTDVTKLVSFEMLWTVFVPGKLVVVRPFLDTKQIMMVEDSPIPWVGNGHSPLSLWAWTWDYDGHQLLKVEHEFKFSWFRGTKNVKDLAVVPLDHFEGADGLKAAVLERSLKFLQYTARCERGAQQVLQYDGPGYADERRTFADDEAERPTSDENDFGTRGQMNEEKTSAGKIVMIKGEFISDAGEYLQNASNKHFPIGNSDRRVFAHDTLMETEDDIDFRNDVSQLDLTKPLDPDNPNYLILPPRLLGYATAQRIWGQISLEKASAAPGPDKMLFEKELQLDDRYKNMILSLVQAHMSKDREPAVRDIVENKGKGLVLLLHGPPGVGKTLTAETVARATGRPLFVVSVAEIGLDASRAERKLEKVFALATKWQAVLLVDEADVFLETRNKTSPPSRNALVSVLLRVLEYYEGIIIMTTNRIKAIDVAVISRIHLAVRYDDLTPGMKAEIFGYYLDQLEKVEPTLIANRDDIDQYIFEYGCSHPFNGRQIRNVVQAAHAYAAFGYVKQSPASIATGRPDGRLEMMAKRVNQKPRLSDGKMTEKHLKEVCEMTRDFQNQLQDETKIQRGENEASRR